MPKAPDCSRKEKRETVADREKRTRMEKKKRRKKSLFYSYSGRRTPLIRQKSRTTKRSIFITKVPLSSRKDAPLCRMRLRKKEGHNLRESSREEVEG